MVKDDQGSPGEGLQGSQELVVEGVVATVGFCNTGVAAKSIEVFQNAKMPLLIPWAAGTPLTAKYPGPASYIFRTSARDAIQAPFVVDHILGKGWDTVAIFSDTTGYGEAEPSNERRASLLTTYKRNFNQAMAVPMAAAQAYDTTCLLMYALFDVRDGQCAITGPALKAALEDIKRVYYGVVGNGLITFANAADAKRNLFVQRKK